MSIAFFIKRGAIYNIASSSTSATSIQYQASLFLNVKHNACKPSFLFLSNRDLVVGYGLNLPC